MGMKRPTSLSATFVKTVKRPGRYGEGRGGHGLSLLVKPTTMEGRLSKTWAQRIRINRIITTLGLGSYPAVTLAEARKRALKNRRAIEEGRNPQGDKTPTFAEAAEKVIRLHAAKWKPGGKSEVQWRASLSNYVYPTIGNKRVDEITSADVMRCLAPIWHTKAVTARRVRQRLRAVMNWCVAQNHRLDDPTATIPAALGNNAQPHQHMRSLHHSKVAGAIENIERSDTHWATIAAFKFLTLTATRSGDVRLAQWNEIDLETATWTIPAERMKSAREHRVPLSQPAFTVLDQARRITDGAGLIFPSSRGQALSDFAMSKLCRQRNIGCVPHGMRSSFRDWCSESGVPREVAEQALAHTVKGVEGAYARSDLLELRRPIMEKWGRYLANK